MVIWCLVRFELTFQQKRVCCVSSPSQTTSLWFSSYLAEGALTRISRSRPSHMSQPSSHFVDLGWLAAPGALHVVGKQMVADTVILKNLVDVFSVGDERLRSKDSSRGAPNRSSLTRDESSPITTTCVRSSKVEANQWSAASWTSKRCWSTSIAFIIR